VILRAYLNFSDLACIQCVSVRELSLRKNCTYYKCALRSGGFVPVAMVPKLSFSGLHLQSSRPRELPPQSLTQPNVNLSIHSAPIDQPKELRQVASAQINTASALRYVPTSGTPAFYALVTFSISASPSVVTND